MKVVLSRPILYFSAHSMKRYYDILGLQEGASKKEIKQAYRKMAMRYHPDLNPGTESKTKFLEILEAYEYLMGIRQMNQGKGLSYEDLQKFYELMKKAAEEKAKREYRQKVREFKREKERKQLLEYKRAAYILVAILVVSVAAWQGFRFYKGLVIDREPIIVEARVTGIGMKRMEYEFPTEDGIFKDHRYVSNNGIEMLSGNGMPLKTGDTFELVFARNKPSYHRVNFKKVSTETMARYFRMVTKRLMYLNYENWEGLSENEKQIRAACITTMVFSKHDFDGLSTIYFAEANVLENLSHNAMSWYFMKNSDEYAEILKVCDGELKGEN